MEVTEEGVGVSGWRGVVSEEFTEFLLVRCHERVVQRTGLLRSK